MAGQITIAEIQSRVCARFGLSAEELRSVTRRRAICRPRQVAMFLARLHTRHSFGEIGRRLGGRDHQTVFHACRQVRRLCFDDPAFAQVVAGLSEELRGVESA